MQSISRHSAKITIFSEDDTSHHKIIKGGIPFAIICL